VCLIIAASCWKCSHTHGDASTHQCDSSCERTLNDGQHRTTSASTQFNKAIAGSALARQSLLLHDGLVSTLVYRDESTVDAINQYDAADRSAIAIACAQRRDDVTHCNGIDMPSCGCHVQITVWRYSKKWKYITYRNAARGGQSHGYNAHENLLKIVHLVTEICSRTGTQTNRHVHHNTPLYRRGRSNVSRFVLTAVLSNKNYTGSSHTLEGLFLNRTAKFDQCW